MKRRCAQCNTPLNYLNKGKICLHGHVAPDEPEANGKVRIISRPDPNQKPEIRSVRGRILATNPAILANMTILEIASLFDCTKASVYCVMTRNGLKFKRLRPERKKYYKK